MEPHIKDEIERMIGKAIARHEMRFSAFGVLTAVLALLLGIAIVGFPPH